jgi:signal peptidase
MSLSLDPQGSAGSWRRRALDAASFVVLIATWWAFLAPAAFGGPASFVIVQGRSMEPAYSEGDLVVARAASEYRVDDVVIFRAADGRRYIIHRIVGGDAVGGWATQGDGNVRADRWSVADDAIIGREWLVLPRIATAIASVQRAPFRFAAAVGLVVTALTLLAHPGSPRPPRPRSVLRTERSVADASTAGLVLLDRHAPRAVAGGSPFDEIEDRLAAMHLELSGGRR